MRRVYQVAALIALAASAWVTYEAHQNLDYYTEYGPGPGFFPFWLGLMLILLSLVWLGQVSLGSVESVPKGFIPDRDRRVQIVAAVVAMVLFAALADVLGFQVMMFVFLLGLITALGRHHPLVTLSLALAGSWSLTYLFRGLLDVQLPTSGIEFLQNLGL